MKKLAQWAVVAVITLVTANVFAMGVQIDGDVDQNVKADNIINLGMGSDVTAEQTIASVDGTVTVGGDVKQNVEADNIINLGMGKGVTARQTVASIRGR